MTQLIKFELVFSVKLSHVVLEFCIVFSLGHVFFSTVTVVISRPAAFSLIKCTVTVMSGMQHQQQSLHLLLFCECCSCCKFQPYECVIIRFVE